MQQTRWPADELLRRYATDEQAREEAIRLSRVAPGAPVTRAAVERMLRLDADTAFWLKRCVEEFGWPRLSEVGSLVAEGAFVLAHQADTDVAFLRKALELMQALLQEGEVAPSHVALLTDRVLIAEGKRQRYGTQCVFDADAGWIPRPCEDASNLNRRRAEMGMDPIEDYLIEMGKVYG